VGNGHDGRLPGLLAPLGTPHHHSLLCNDRTRPTVVAACARLVAGSPALSSDITNETMIARTRRRGGSAVTWRHVLRACRPFLRLLSHDRARRARLAEWSPANSARA